MPSYGGSAMFGYAVRMKTVINPSANQINEFFGVNGRESLFGGTRGRVTLVEGLLRGPSPASLKLQEEAFALVDDGRARTLNDTFEYSYSNVIFKSWEPVSDRIIRDVASGDYLRQYRAQFEHLTTS